jgi:hypothetical protein
MINFLVMRGGGYRLLTGSYCMFCFSISLKVPVMHKIQGLKSGGDTIRGVLLIEVIQYFNSQVSDSS